VLSCQTWSFGLLIHLVFRGVWQKEHVWQYSMLFECVQKGSMAHGHITVQLAERPGTTLTCYIRGADKSLGRPTSRCILFAGENISFDASLVIQG
jgi:hypothetical protein